MKYAKEVVELLGAFPGREWRLAEIVRYVCPENNGKRYVARKGVMRVLDRLIENGVVAKSPIRGIYIWK